MIARMGSGWQTVLADLSLILFMVTATALSDSPAKAPPPAPLPCRRWANRLPSGGPNLAGQALKTGWPARPQIRASA